MLIDVQPDKITIILEQHFALQTEERPGYGYSHALLAWRGNTKNTWAVLFRGTADECEAARRKINKCAILNKPYCEIETFGTKMEGANGT